MFTEKSSSLEQIDEINKVIALTDRVKRRKDEYLEAIPHLASERSRLVTESWKQTEGEPLDIRRAKLFNKIMEEEEEELGELKKLSPQERIKKLKELQEKNKEEIEQAQKMLAQAEDEAQIEQELKEIPIPQLKAVDIDELFSPEEKELFKAKRLVAEKPKEEKEEPEEKAKGELEEIAAHAPAISKEEEQHVQYIRQLSQRPTEQLLDRATELYGQFKQQGYLSPAQQEEFNNIEYANRQKLRDIEAGRYAEISKSVANEMVLIEKMKNATYRR